MQNIVNMTVKTS